MYVFHCFSTSVAENHGIHRKNVWFFQPASLGTASLGRFPDGRPGLGRVTPRTNGAGPPY